MSRDAFSYDPQDAGETRDTSTRRSVCQRRSTSPDTRDRGNPAGEAPCRGDGTQFREQRTVRDERNDSPRAYCVRDRAYLLRDSEMDSLKQIGKFRVIPVSDLAKFAYSGDHRRKEKDTHPPPPHSLPPTQTHPTLPNTKPPHVTLPTTPP